MKRMIFALLLAAAGLALVWFITHEGASQATGNTVAKEDTPDIVEIDKDDMTSCCTRKNSLGEEKSCYALNGRDCSHCDTFCN